MHNNNNNAITQFVMNNINEAEFRQKLQEINAQYTQKLLQI